MNRIEMIKKAAMTVEAKKLGLTVEQYEGKLICDTLDARKAATKESEKLRRKEERKIKKDLEGQVKKSGHLASGSLDFNRPENMFYSDKENAKFLSESSMMDAYNANRSADGEDWDY